MTKRHETGRPNFLQIIHSSNSGGLKNYQLQDKGINVDGERLLYPRFADDVTLATEGVKKCGTSVKHCR